MYIIVAVFLAGLMVGRTPEYLGKKVESKEVKLAMMAILIHPLLILARRRPVRGDGLGAKTTANPGPHGFCEILYEFSSACGQQRLGLRGPGRQQRRPGTSPRGSCCSWAGSRRSAAAGPGRVLAVKKRVPETTGTLRTDNLTFAGMLLGTVLLVGALSFMPAVVLGPVADHLIAIKP